MNRLAYDVSRELPGLRREAEGRMVDRCRITRSGGDPVFDPDTGDYTTPPAVVIYTGRCEVQVREGLQLREVQAGGTELSLTRLIVKIPTSVTGVQVDDLVEILTGTNDRRLAGKAYRVVADHTKTWATARRLHVEEVTA